VTPRMLTDRQSSWHTHNALFLTRVVSIFCRVCLLLQNDKDGPNDVNTAKDTSSAPRASGTVENEGQ
jgi:hypothetical protein